MADQLLFVNKTPSSSLLTRSQRAEKAKILSHVQSNRRKQEAKKAGRNVAGQRQTGAGTRVGSILPAGTVIYLDPSTDDAYQSSDAQRRQGLLSPISTSSTSISLTYPTHNSSDPFHCTVASTDAGNHILLHCTLYPIWRRMFLGEAFAPAHVVAAVQTTSQGRSTDANPDKKHAFFTQRLRRCVEDPALMYATLAYGSSYLAWSTGHMPPTPPAEYFLGKALEEVRMRLATTYQQQQQQRQPPTKGIAKKEPVDPWLILAIYSLAVTEQWNGMPEIWRRFPQKYSMVVRTGKLGRGASRVHMRALLRLVALAGGWDGLPDEGGGLKGHLLNSAVMADKYLSMYEFTEPLVPLDWARGVGAVPPTDFAENPFPRMGTGFAAVPDSVLSPEVKATMADIVSYCSIAHVAWERHSEGGMDSAMEIWLFRRLQELTCRLMVLGFRAGGGAEGQTHGMNIYGEYPSPVWASSPGGCKPRFSSSVDQCVCLAGQIFLLGCMANKGVRTAARYQGLRLRVLMMDHLDRLKKYDSPMDKGLKMWCLSTAALLSGKFPARGWFIEKMKEVLVEDMKESVDGLITEEVLRAALEPYLFLEDRQREGMGHVVWEV